MALTIYIERSRTGITEAAFSPLSDFPDPGGIFDLEDHDVVPGHLYIYRARRFDSATGLYSPWSQLAFARAPFPLRSRITMDPEDVRTGVETAVWFGLEAFQGIPHKVQDQAAYVSGGVNRDIMKAYSKRLRRAPSMRRNLVGGRVQFEGSLEVEITPEGFVPRLLCCLHPVTTQNLTVPTRYQHTWKNQFGARSGTLVQRKGNTLYVYPGTRVTSFEITPNKDSDDVLAATFGLVALDELVYDLVAVPGVLTDLGIASAAEDALDNYSHQDAIGYIGGVEAGIRSSTFSVNKNLGRRNVQDGTRGTSGTFERLAETTGSANLFYETDINLQRDFGVTSPTTGYAVGDTIATAPVSAVFSPPENPSGFSNELEIAFPAADIKTAQPVEGPDEVPENLTFAPIDEIGNAEETDFLIRITNEQSNTDLITPAAPFVGTTAFDATTRSRVKKYEYGKATGTPTTTSVVSAANAYISAVNDYYNGRKLRFISGALVGVERLITDYVGSTRTFTTAAFGSAPAAGDVFVIV